MRLGIVTTNAMIKDAIIGAARCSIYSWCGEGNKHQTPVTSLDNCPSRSYSHVCLYTPRISILNLLTALAFDS